MCMDTWPRPLTYRPHPLPQTVTFTALLFFLSYFLVGCFPLSRRTSSSTCRRVIRCQSVNHSRGELAPPTSLCAATGQNSRHSSESKELMWDVFKHFLCTLCVVWGVVQQGAEQVWVWVSSLILWSLNRSISWSVLFQSLSSREHSQLHFVSVLTNDIKINHWLISILWSNKHKYINK